MFGIFTATNITVNLTQCDAVLFDKRDPVLAEPVPPSSLKLVRLVVVTFNVPTAINTGI